MTHTKRREYLIPFDQIKIVKIVSTACHWSEVLIVDESFNYPRILFGICLPKQSLSTEWYRSHLL